MPMLARLGYSTFWHSERSFDSSCQSFFQERMLQEYLSRALLYENLYPTVLHDMRYFTYTDARAFINLLNYQEELLNTYFTESFTVMTLGQTLHFKLFLELKTSNVTLFTPNIYWTGNLCIIHLRHYTTSANKNIYPMLWFSIVSGLLDQWCNLSAWNRKAQKKCVRGGKKI